MWSGRAFLHRKNARFYPFSFRNQVSPFSILGRMFEAIIGVHVMRNGIIFVVVITFILDIYLPKENRPIDQPGQMHRDYIKN